MNYNQYRLLKEIVKFLELSQALMVKGKINRQAYIDITGFKFQFLNDILKDITITPALSSQISKLLINNDCLLGLGKSIVGN